MRLSDEDREGIIEAIKFFIKEKKAILYLYGSRVRDDLRGGDIDLLLIVDEVLCKSLSAEKHKILARIKKNVGDQKIDLLISTQSNLKVDPFLEVISSSLTPIKEWK